MKTRAPWESLPGGGYDPMTDSDRDALPPVRVDSPCSAPEILTRVAQHLRSIAHHAQTGFAGEKVYMRTFNAKHIDELYADVCNAIDAQNVELSFKKGAKRNEL